MIIGVTGPSGAGKSTFSFFLKKNGFVILDADLIVNSLYKKNETFIEEVKKEFPFVFLDGVLNKKKLSEHVFSNKEDLEKLALICNRFVLKILEDEIKKNKGRNIVIDAPTLFESRVNLFCDKTVSVIAKKEKRLNRVVKRDNILKEIALKRFSCQPDDEFYIKNSDVFFVNDGDISFLEREMQKILKIFLK